MNIEEGGFVTIHFFVLNCQSYILAKINKHEKVRMAQAFYVQTPDSERHHASRHEHIESPARLNTIRNALGRAGLLPQRLTELHYRGRAQSAEWRARAMFDELAIVHDKGYLQKLARACQHAPMHHEQYLDRDTYLTRSTFAVVADSTFLVKTAVEQALQQRASAFCAVRPPGHHAGSRSFGGFCLVNFSAYAAQLARSRGCGKVAIIDWDVHYGNGTQHIFKSDADVFYMSLHGSGLFPPGGKSTDKGTGTGRGFTQNIVVPPRMDDQQYLASFNAGIENLQKVMRPDMVVISSGFDAHAADPIGNLSLTAGIYDTLTNVVREAWPRAPIVSVLEGGYDLKALGQGAVAHVKSLTS